MMFYCLLCFSEIVCCYKCPLSINVVLCVYMCLAMFGSRVGNLGGSYGASVEGGWGGLAGGVST